MTEMHAVKLRTQDVIIPLRFPPELMQHLDRAVSMLRYRSRNQLIREAVERQVNELLSAKVVEVREMTVGEAAKAIDEYVSKHPGAHHVSELSEMLGIDLGVAFEAVQRLTSKGTVRVRKGK